MLPLLPRASLELYVLLLLLKVYLESHYYPETAWRYMHSCHHPEPA
jgi:hypothetical protein